MTRFEGTPAMTGGDPKGANSTVVIKGNGDGRRHQRRLRGLHPHADFNGTDSFTYTATPGGVTETTTVDVTVRRGRRHRGRHGDLRRGHAPPASWCRPTIRSSGTPDHRDADGAHGTVAINDNGTAGNIADDFLVYTPTADFNGTDTFTYTVTTARRDGDGHRHRDGQRGRRHRRRLATTNEDTPVTILVQANDTFENPPMRSPPRSGHGTVTSTTTARRRRRDDFVIYTPIADFNGTDTFTYTVTSGGATETGDRQRDDHAGRRHRRRHGHHQRGHGRQHPGAGNDTFEHAGDHRHHNGAHGTVTVNNNGTPGNTADDFVVYTPAADFNGTDTFTYTVTSGGVTETGHRQRHHPAVADIVNDSATIDEDTGRQHPDVLANDTFENAGRDHRPTTARTAPSPSTTTARPATRPTTSSSTRRPPTTTAPTASPNGDHRRHGDTETATV